jgi:hypothetical protein
MGAVRAIGSVVVSSLYVFACAHVFLSSLLAFRFLGRAGVVPPKPVSPPSSSSSST